MRRYLTTPRGLGYWGSASEETPELIQVIARNNQRRNKTMEDAQAVSPSISETIFTHIGANNAGLASAIVTLSELADRMLGLDLSTKPCEEVQVSDTPPNYGTLHQIHDELMVSDKRLNTLNECIRRLEVL